jgi:hypothetical protein
MEWKALEDAHVREEDTRDASLGVMTLGMALCGVVTARQAALVAGNGVLVSLDDAVGGLAEVAQVGALLGVEAVGSLLAEGEEARRHNLDKVHVVVVGVVSLLLVTIQRVQVVVGERLEVLADAVHDLKGQLRTESQAVDCVGEVVADIGVPVVLEIVHVHVAAAEAAAGGQVEVSDDLVDTNASLNAAALMALGLELLGVVLALALLDALTLAKGPRCLRIGLADLLAGVAAAGLDGVRRGRGAVAGTAVVRVQMGGFLLGRVATTDYQNSPWMR